MNWPPERQALRGALVELEPAEPLHRDELLAAAADPAIWEWMDRLIPGSDAQFDRWFEDRLQASAEGREWCWVTRRAGGEVVGSSSYLNVRPDHDGLEIGWTWLNPSVWRTGANREAKLLMCGFAFDELGCVRIEFKADARNTRSREALESLGATFEGVFRKHMLMPGIGRRDSAYFSITDAEWPEVRRRLTEDMHAEA